MSDALLPIATDPVSIERAADPGEFVVLACERAKEWLAQAIEQGEIDQLVEVKSQAEAIRVYTAQKQIGHDAELAAAEVVRRAERGIGLAIRRGQEAGEIVRRGQSGGPRSPYTRLRHGVEEHVQVQGGDSMLKSPTDFVPGHELSSSTTGGIYALTDEVDDDQFDQALEEARAEKNLTRTNVVRKIRDVAARRANGIDRSSAARQERERRLREMADNAYTSRQIAKALNVTPDWVYRASKELGIEIPADRAVQGTRLIDSMRVMESTALSAENVTAGVDLINYEELDPARLDEWVSSLDHAIKSLTTLKRRLMKELTRG